MKSVLDRTKQFILKRWLLILIVVLGLGAFLWWRGQATKKPVVKTTAVEQKDLKKVLTVSGHIDAHKRTQMYFLSGGKVTYLGAAEGDSVKKGQTIAMLDPRSAQKTLEKTLSTYQTQRWSYENVSDTRENRTLTEAERRLADQDQFALNRSVIDVQLQSLAIESTRLSAPFAGILVKSPILTVGGEITAADTFEIVDPTSLYFTIQVDEVDTDQVEIGQTVEVRLDARPDQVLHATVRKIAFKSVETSTGTVFPVELEFTDPVDIIHQRVGMNGDADIILDTRSHVLSVPVSAISTKDGKQFVQVKKGEAVEERPVEIGLETDNDVEILSGLSANDQVVLP